MPNKKKRIFLIISLCAVLVAGWGFVRYFSHFNKIVKRKFDGKLWELPARVYARPLELYLGMELKPALLARELEAMQYIQVKRPVNLDNPGKFIWAGNTFRIFCRPFAFEDGKSPSKKISVVIRQGKVDILENLEEKTFPELFRMDPVLIGSFYPAHKEDRILVRRADVSPLLVQTLLAVEDRKFYEHHGVDFLSILRAAIANIRKRRVVQGASTLTQQLAKNFFLTNEKTVRRKFEEMFMALSLEWNYEKDEILEAYLNEIYLGQDGQRAIHGFGLGSAFYFGKTPDTLLEHEIALLVGLLKGPSLYDPRQNPDRALKRRNTVLKVMADQHLISPDVLKSALSKSSGVIKTPPRGATRFPAYMDLVRRQLLLEYREEDLRSEGLRIFTVFDPQVQIAAENAVGTQLKAIETRRRLPRGKLEVSAVITSTMGNDVLALVGGRDPKLRGFNRALDARRPIGSLIKPVVYLTALNRPERYTLVSRIDDSFMRVTSDNGKVWTPKNYDRKYHGAIPLYDGLVHSYNVATVRLGMELGLDQVFDTLRAMGHTRETKPYPSALLGTAEMSPLEVAQMYQTLAAGGFYSPARSIRAVYKPDGTPLQRYPLTVKQNFDPVPVYLLNKILQAVVVEGTARSLKHLLPHPLGTAGKTGTTNSLKDSWFAGFTGNRLAVVWVGRDDNKSCKLTGASGALQIWGKIMAGISNKVLELPQPEGVEWAVIDIETGLRTEEACGNATAIPFARGSAPADIISCEDIEDRHAGEERVEPASKEKEEKSKSSVFRWIKDLFKERPDGEGPVEWEREGQ
ncbi:MAG: penicillin-binding protein 1B [Desulfobacteraceae bacterium 4572_88]|nr:MAG: penicillin-binding protein 1B [Desulfobacteraceae bacterium 4572_88]